MRSGNGRHRRPRQAPALFVTAGVTGAGLAMPLLAAGGAQAADGATWDRVAECESGGLWSANSGNGYYGGLQLTMETWEGYGGTELAARPDLASRGQQIEIAEKILADRGPEAWPSCSISVGLLPEDADLPDTPDVDLPDAPDSPDVETPDAPELPDGSGDSGNGGADGGGSDGANGGGSADPAPGETSGPGGGRAGSPGSDDSTGSDGSGDPTGSDAGSHAGSGTGGGVGGPEQQPSPGAHDDAGEDATDGTGAGRHRGTPGDERPGDADRSSRGQHGKPENGADDGEYQVRRGDSLSAIAAEEDIPGGWTTLYENNRETVGADPDLILPGQLLDLRTGGELR